MKAVTDEDGKPIAYSFDASGKIVFRPNKPGKQTITVELKDGTKRQFVIEGKEGDSPILGEVGFIPDASGQNVSSKVAIDGKVDPVQEQREQQQPFAGKRIRLTFDGQGLAGAQPGSLKSLLFDKMEFPIFAAQIVEGGKLDVEPQVFFFVRDYKSRMGQYPLLKVAFNYQNKVRIVKAKLSSLPELPEGQPESARPEQFKSGQTLNVALEGTPEDVTDLNAYLQNSGASKIGAPPQQGQQPPPRQG